MLSMNIKHVAGNGCMPKICGGQEANIIESCPRDDGTCGQYKGKRVNNVFTEAVDLQCTESDDVFSPISGKLSYYKPFGGESEYDCKDEGAKIEGTGQWKGYYVHIWPVTLEKYGGNVAAGEKLGKASNMDCEIEVAQRSSKNFLRIELFKGGKAIDPTFHLIDCMCTGWICESNPNNKLIGNAFKADNRYNGVRGWELECPNMVYDEYNSDEAETRRADIYSPIDGKIFGRIRLTFKDGAYEGCNNDGIFIVGEKQWVDFEARIYNVGYYNHLKFGNKFIQKGQPIGRRLTCVDAPDSVFVELRFQGRLINVTDLITADSCKMPNLPIF
uniref:Peptidase_M23 domain-containing protein n=1 Tax=Rhabditophanes sp. KR3021 TaxID=114890 RepID=A0AC35U7M6_9BILA